jgi:hypothetical protein
VRRLLFGLIAICGLTLLTSVGSALAVDPSGVTFDQDGSVSVSVSRPSPGASAATNELRFALINGSTSDTTIRLYAVAGSGEAAASKLPFGVVGGSGRPGGCVVTPAPDNGDTTLVATIGAPAGRTCPVAIPIDPSRGAVAYSGTLVATDTSGATDTLGFTIAVADASPAKPSPSFDQAKGVLESPLPDSVSLTAVSWRLVPRFWIFDYTLWFPVGAPVLQVDSAAAKSVTPLLGGDGTIVPAILDPDTRRLTIPTIPGPGTYTGSLVGSDGKAAAKLTLTVKDALPMPLLVLLIGVILGFLGQRYISYLRPRREFETQMKAFIDQARAATEREQAAIDGPANRYPLPHAKAISTYWGVDEGALGRVIREARALFISSGDPAARDTAFALDGPKMTPISKVLQDAEDARGAATTVSAYYWQVRSDLERSHQPCDFESSVWHQQTVLLLQGGPVDNPARLEAVKTDRTTLAAKLATAEDYIERLGLLHRQGASDELVDAVRDALCLMVGWDEADWAPVDAAMAKAKARKATSVWRRRHVPTQAMRAESLNRAEPVPAARGRAPGGFGVLALAESFDIAGQLEGVLRQLLLVVRWLLLYVWHSSLIERLRSGESVYIAFVGFAAILTGLNLYYLTSASFGSLADYLTLFLWGLSASALVDLAKTPILARLAKSLPA